MMIRWLSIICGVIWAVPALAQSSLHLAGQILGDAKLASIDEQGQFVFNVAKGTQSVAGNQIVHWSSGRSVSPSSAVALSDGSWLAGQLDWTSNHAVRIKSQWFEAVDIEVDNTRALLLQASPSWPQVQQLQKQMLSPTGSADVLWKRNAESAAGIVAVGLKKGINDLGPDRAAFTFKTQSSSPAKEIDQADMAGVTFSPALRRPLPGRADCVRLNLVDGSQLWVKEIKRQADGRVQCTLGSGQVLVALDDAAGFIEAIATITATPAGITWLSDLEPARYRLIDTQTKIPWPLGRDRDLFGKAMFDQQGQIIEHALVMHAASQVAYRWNEQPTQLLAEVALLPQPSGGQSRRSLGSAQCQVLVGRNNQLVQVWQSGIVRAEEPPIQVEVDVSNAQLVVLLVDQADQGSTSDHLVWRHARLAEKK